MLRFVVVIPHYAGKLARLVFQTADDLNMWLADQADVVELFGRHTEFTITTEEVQPDGTIVQR